MSDLVKTDKDMDLIEALENRFSLHDVDMIYNLLSKFSIIDTKQGEITFNDFIKTNNQFHYRNMESMVLRIWCSRSYEIRVILTKYVQLW